MALLCKNYVLSFVTRLIMLLYLRVPALKKEEQFQDKNTILLKTRTVPSSLKTCKACMLIDVLHCSYLNYK